MSYGRVLLVRMPYRSLVGSAISFHVGLGYIAETLYRQGIGYEVLDMNLRYTRTDLLNKVREYKPDLVAITLMTMHYQYHYNDIRAIKEAFPQVKIVVGGPHCSTFREKVLEQCREVDYGVVLEGEQAIVELCSGQDPAQIKGLLHRQEGQVVYNGDRPLMRDLDSVPFPTFRNFELHKYRPFVPVPIHTTRGCPYHCTYCPVALAIGKLFRMRSPDNVVDEFAYWYDKGIRTFHVWDDNFTLNEARVLEICDKLEARGLKDMEIGVPNGIRADRASRAVLERMREVGFNMIALGVESASDHVLDNVKKGSNVAQMERAIKDACELGYKVFLYFMIGAPGETYEDFQKSLRLAQKYPVAEARFYTLIPFPGTELYSWAEEKGYLVRPPSEYLNTADHFVNEPCLATPEFPLEERRRAFREGRRVTRQIVLGYRMGHLRGVRPLRWLVASFLLTGLHGKLFRKRAYHRLFFSPLKKLLRA